MLALAWQFDESRLIPPPGSEGLETSYEHSWFGPPWWTALVLLLAIAIVVACYWHERGTANRGMRLLLAFTRLGLIALVVWMIYGWVRQRHRTDLPDLIIVVDDSQSMATIDTWDDPQFRREWIDRLTGRGLEASRYQLALQLLFDGARPWHEALAARYHVRWYFAGETLRTVGETEDNVRPALTAQEPKQSSSRLGQAVLDVLQLQRGRPTAAIVLLTDGITTDGPALGEAAQQARRRQTPLYVVGIGSEQAPRDVRLSDLRVDEVAFVGDVLNFDVQVAAQGYQGKTVRLRLRREGDPAVLSESRVAISDDDAHEVARLTYRPLEEGRFAFRIEADPLPGEVNLTNNSVQADVTVTEETVNVLMVQGGPSYEYRYLKTLLARSLNVGSRAGKKAIDLRVVLEEADWEYASQDESSLRVFPVTREELYQYDVLILGDINPAPLGANALSMIVDFVQTRGGGLIVLAGPRFMPRAFQGTPLADVLPCNPNGVTLPDPAENLVAGFQPRLTPLGAGAAALQLADSPNANAQLWQELPPLYWLAALSELKPGVRVLAEHPNRTSTDGQSLAVITLQFNGAGKVLFHASDDFWRWSRDPQFEPAYARYWLQWLRYLSRAKLQGGSRSAQLTSDREEYQRGESVRLQLRFFDERVAPARDDGATLILEREGAGRRHVPLVRDSTDRGLFGATVGQLAEGQYRVGLLNPALEEPPAPLRFAVVAPPGEQARLEMDGAELRTAAKRSDGRFYRLGAASSLLDDLPPGRQVRIESLPVSPLWNRWPVAALFVSLIVMEWIVRKRVGML